MARLLKMIQRGWRVLRDNGPRTFLANTREYLKRLSITRNGIKVSYQTGTRVDFEDRWDLLSPHVESEDASLLDIGCAEGELTTRFATKGLLSIGIERRAHTVAAARSNVGDKPNVGFVQSEITPETINSLPRTDVVLLLTVYHHWISEFGWEDAEAMLRTVGAGSEKLILEVPRREPNRPAIEAEELESIEQYYRRYLEVVFDGDASVEHLGTTSYQGDERKDVIYLIDCSSVERISTENGE